MGAFRCDPHSNGATPCPTCGVDLLEERRRAVEVLPFAGDEGKR